MPDIQTAYQFVIDKCNDPDVGYSQSYRNEQTVNGKTYYDCSSLMWYGLKAGGFDVVAAYEQACWGYEGNAIVTAYLEAWLLALGFVEIPIGNTWKPGDILWRSGHTEMVYDGRRTMGAHSSTYAFENQVSINTNASSVSSWTKCFRYLGGETPDPDEPEPEEPENRTWIIGGRSEYLTEEQMKNNAILIYQFFSAKGWTVHAIAGLCGNIEVESTFNPNLNEIGGTGIGLVQWTPPENLYAVLDVLYGSHSDWNKGEKQCNVLYAEYEEACNLADRGIEKQWYNTSDYDMSWSEWSNSEMSPEYLATVFMRNYERPNLSIDNGHLDRRTAAALKWFQFFIEGNFNIGDVPHPTPHYTPKKKHYNFILFNRRKRGNQF